MQFLPAGPTRPERALMALRREARNILRSIYQIRNEAGAYLPPNARRTIVVRNRRLNEIRHVLIPRAQEAIRIWNRNEATGRAYLNYRG